MKEQHKQDIQHACDEMKKSMEHIMEQKLQSQRVQHQTDIQHMKHDITTQHTMIISGMEMKYNTLQKTMDEKEGMITTLTTQLSSIRGKMSDLEMEMERKTVSFGEMKLQMKQDAEVRDMYSFWVI